MFQLIFSSSQLQLHLQLHLLLHRLADVVARRSHPKKGSEEPQKGERPRNTHDKPRQLVADVVARCSHVKKGS